MVKLNTFKLLFNVAQYAQDGVQRNSADHQLEQSATKLVVQHYIQDNKLPSELPKDLVGHVVQQFVSYYI